MAHGASVTVSVMEPQGVATLMHQLKGAPLSILIVMGYFNRAMGRDELAMVTSYSANTVGKGLEKLAFMGLAREYRRFDGWMLTSQARQLPLLMGGHADDLAIEADADAPATGPDVASAEGDGGSRGVKNLHLGSSSCSEGIVCDVDVDSGNNNNHQGREVQNLHFDSDGEAAVAALVATGMPATSRRGNGARDAVAAALAEGWSGAEALAAVQGWLAYAEGGAGSGIQHAGFFTAAKVRGMVHAPVRIASTLSRDDEARRYIAEAYERVVRH